MESLIQQLIDKEELFIVLVITGAVVVTSIAKTIGSTIRAAGRERTRREIAAYIAEGTMSPDQGERLMAAGARRDADA